MIPNLPMQSEIIEHNNPNAKNLTSPDHSKRTNAHQKTTKDTPLIQNKSRVSIPIPILHNYNTRAATKMNTITPPRVIATLPRVRKPVPTCQNVGPALTKNFHGSIINYKVHTGKLPKVPVFNNKPTIHVEKVNTAEEPRINYRGVLLNVNEVFAPREKCAIPIELEAQWLANSVMDENGNPMEYRHLMKRSADKIIWEQGMCRELGRLSNGYGNIAGTQTIRFIAKARVPKGAKITYMRIVCTYRPNKSDKHRVRLCAGGDRLVYDGPLRTPTADLPTIKMHVNSTISLKGARYMTGDVKNFYLGTPMKNFEYAKYHRRNIPQEFIDLNNLEQLFNEEGFIYMQIERGMYGLKQAGKIANEQLIKKLVPHGYRPTRTPGLWKHDNKPISFTLIVDDFGVKYIHKKDAEDLMEILRAHYEAITTDWTGSLYSGITLYRDYKHGKVNLSMPGYVLKALFEFQHDLPDKCTLTSHPYVPPVYGKKVQIAQQESNAPILPKE